MYRLGQKCTFNTHFFLLGYECPKLWVFLEASRLPSKSPKSLAGGWRSHRNISLTSFFLFEIAINASTAIHRIILSITGLLGWGNPTRTAPGCCGWHYRITNGAQRSKWNYHQSFPELWDFYPFWGIHDPLLWRKLVSGQFGSLRGLSW